MGGVEKVIRAAPEAPPLIQGELVKIISLLTSSGSPPLPLLLCVSQGQDESNNFFLLKKTWPGKK